MLWIVKLSNGEVHEVEVPNGRYPHAIAETTALAEYDRKHGRKDYSVYAVDSHPKLEELSVGTQVMVYDKHDGTWLAEITDTKNDGRIMFVLSGDDKEHTGRVQGIAWVLGEDD